MSSSTGAVSPREAAPESLALGRVGRGAGVMRMGLSSVGGPAAVGAMRASGDGVANSVRARGGPSPWTGGGGAGVPSSSSRVGSTPDEVTGAFVDLAAPDCQITGEIVDA